MLGLIGELWSSARTSPRACTELEPTAAHEGGRAFGLPGSPLLEAREWAFALGAGPAFNLSALLLNYVLYRSRLIPRWLSIWGLIGAALWTAVWFPQAFGIELGVLELAFLPIAVQKMVFGGYLIVAASTRRPSPTSLRRPISGDHVPARRQHPRWARCEHGS